MPNQMIALSGRPAQIHSPASLAQRYGAVMNTLAQQRAAERQAAASAQNIAQSQQQMAFAAAQRGEESRAANQEFSVAEMARLLNRATAIERSVDPEATYQNWLNDVEHVDPAAAATFRQASPHYNPQFMLNVMGEAENFIRARVPTATAQTMLGAGGQAFNVVAGAPEIATATPVIVGNAPGTGAAPRAAAPPAAVPQMPFDEAFSDLSSDALTPAQAAPILGNAARTGTINQSDVTRLQSSLPPQGRPQVDQFINQRGVVVLPQSYSPSGGGQPAAQPLTLETAAPVIQAAVQNGNIGQNDLQALRQMVGPQMEPQLAQWMQQNNIRITPAGEPSMRSAVYRPGQDAAPRMTQVQSNAVGTQFYGRDPSVGALPGSSLVPLDRVAAEAAARREPISEAAARAAAGRESPAEAAAVAEARARGTAAGQRATRTEGRRQVSTILNDIRRDYASLNDMAAIPSNERPWYENFGDYMASSRIGREAQSAFGTRAGTLLNTVSNSRHLLTNALKNATGMTAAQMSSNVELQLLLDSLSDPTQGYEAAIETIRRIEELYGAPRAQSRRGAPADDANRPRLTRDTANRFRRQ